MRSGCASGSAIRLPWTRWVGGALSVAGLYIVVGGGAGLSTNSIAGDALVFASREHGGSVREPLAEADTRQEPGRARLALG